MMRWTVLLRASLLLIGLFIGYFLIFVHPNDRRISFVDRTDPQGRSIEETLKPLAESLTLAASVLQSPLEHQLDIDMEAFKAARGRLLKLLPDYAVVHTHRFTSPYEIYAPIGEYPVRLEAVDGIFVPAGSTLTVSPKLQGHYDVRFSAVADSQSSARLEVRLAHQEVMNATLPAIKAQVANGNGFWQKNFERFLFVDRAQDVSRWSSFRAGIDLVASSDALTFKCVSASGMGCIVSDVRFFTKAATAPKSVIVILVDTLRADGLASPAATAMQSLAARSTEFSQAMAAGNMTSPSTNAFLSCRRPSDLGGLAFSYSATGVQRENFYSDQPPSFPARFRQAGFDTAMIGNVSVISEIYGVGVQHGFDRQVSIERDAYDTPDITREAIDWLRENADHPFLLYLHYNGPHAPYRAPFVDLKRTWPGWRVLKSYPSILRWLYQSEISYTDRYIAKLMAALKSLGLEDRVEILLTADHGDQHSLRRFEQNEAGPGFEGAYFDHGATLFNDEIHVPLLIHEPGQAEHRVVNAYVTGLDVAPTLLESFGIQQGESCAGRSLVSAVKTGHLSEELVSRTIGVEAFQGRAVFFGGRYKFIRLYEPTDKLVFDDHQYGGERRVYYRKRQLFDLLADPSEEHDLSDDSPDLLAQAEKIYAQFYDVKDAFELIIDDPANGSFEVELPADTAPAAEFDDIKIHLDGPMARLSGTGRRRSIIKLKMAPVQLPRVRIGNKPIAVELTSMRLPLTITISELPREQSGRFSLPDVGSEAAAYIRRVEDNGQDNRRIVTGNPRFESVLREWGYLNDK